MNFKTTPSQEKVKKEKEVTKTIFTFFSFSENKRIDKGTLACGLR